MRRRRVQVSGAPRQGRWVLASAACVAVGMPDVFGKPPATRPLSQSPSQPPAPQPPPKPPHLVLHLPVCVDAGHDGVAHRQVDHERVHSGVGPPIALAQPERVHRVAVERDRVRRVGRDGRAAARAGGTRSARAGVAVGRRRRRRGAAGWRSGRLAAAKAAAAGVSQNPCVTRGLQKQHRRVARGLTCWRC